MFNRIKRLVDRGLDKAASAVQNFTGETERRNLVSEIKTFYENFKRDLSKKIHAINLVIEAFNKKIEALNDYRRETVKRNINSLGKFLSHFGTLKSTGQFALEEKQSQVEHPKKQLETIENYIDDVDWSKDEVFTKTFFKGVMGVRRETKKLNISATGKLGELKLEEKRALKLADSKQQFVKEDIQILEMYQDSVKAISETIEEKIIPEMELIQAFLQCDEIKNQILANQAIALKEKTDISLLAGTIHHKHYQFIKNTFMFFTISRKIYNTPVLTRLMNNEQHKEERQTVLQYGETLTEQQELLKETMVG